MKKLATLLLAAGLVIGASTGASAIDFKAKGVWNMSFDYGQNGMFTGGNGMTGFTKGQDDFEARQRVRLQLDAVASESLSGTVFFEIGGQTWGKADGASGGAALGADSTDVIKLRRAYIDWIVPETDLKVRMGIQGFDLPSFTTGSQVFSDDTAGVVASYKFNDNVGLTAFWMRPYNDNYGGYDRGGYYTVGMTPWGTPTMDYHDGKSGYNANYLDNMDLVGLTLPLTFDGVNVTPWGMYGQIGPNTFNKYVEPSQAEYPYLVWNGGSAAQTFDPANWRWGANSTFNYFGNAPGQSGARTLRGILPAGGQRHRDGTSAAKKLKNYGQIWFAGVTGEVTMWDPFRLAWDFNYGSVSWLDDARLSRSGWLASLLLEYKMDWGIPGLYGWYSSGDDGNPSNGSERMPYISADNTDNGFSNFAFNGAYEFRREAVIGEDMAGTWGIGFRLKDMSFVENLKHTFRVNYIGGTNSPAMARKLDNQFTNGAYPVGTYDMVNNKFIGGNPLNWGPNANSMYSAPGMEPLYMTTEDSALELGLLNTYKMYDNFTVYLEGNYLFTWIDQKRSMWGNSKMNGKSDNVRDPWNINLSFVYAF